MLIVDAQGRRCALALADLVETLRPLPVQPVSGLPAFVLGLAVIRGAPVPVVDLGLLLGCAAQTPCNRYVTVRAGSRVVALAVGAVLGVRRLEPALLEQLPPLLQDLHSGAVQALAALDRELLMVLAAGKLLTDEHWRELDERRAAIEVAGAAS